MVGNGALITCEPALNLWAETARQNRANFEHRSLLHFSIDGIRAFRKKMLELASEFTCNTLGDATISKTFNLDHVIIAAGHQPVIYHSGVARKNAYLSEVERQGGVIGLQIIIDTDTGVAGQLSFPERSETSPYKISEAVLSHGGEVYASQRIMDRGRLEEIFSGVTQAVLPSLRSTIEHIRDRYLLVANQDVVSAQAKVRRYFEDSPSYLELPLTILISMPESRRFLGEIIGNGSNFHSHFNEQLNAFRLERKIKNHANPFPNLAQDGGIIELPFWVIDRTFGTREALYADQAHGILRSKAGFVVGPIAQAEMYFDWSNDERYRLAPRALLITALLRTLCSDLFIHGLGGARYDAFLDRLLESYWNISPPAFAVASETCYLFPEQVRELDETQALLASAREIQFHLDRYLDNGTFPDELARSLKTLWHERLKTREDLIKIKQEGNSAAEATQALKEIDAKIKTELNGFFSKRTLPSDNVIDAMRWREFPFMYFTRSDR